MENPAEFEFSSFSFLLFLRARIYLCVRWERERVVSSGRSIERESVVDSVGRWAENCVVCARTFFSISLSFLSNNISHVVHSLLQRLLTHVLRIDGK